MPNCQWFGTVADHRRLLDLVFADPELQVMEHYSQPDQPLRRFTSVHEVLVLFDRLHEAGPSASKVNLMLWVRESGPSPQVKRYKVQSGPLAGRWMERCEPMGGIVLSLEGGRGTLLPYSSTNTVTEVSLGAVDGKVTDENGTVWDVRLTNQRSFALNRKIRKLAVGKISSLVVLPGAAERWFAGHDFGLSPNAAWSMRRTPEAFVQR